eukprot:2248739-Amphidinium_carterae.1
MAVLKRCNVIVFGHNYCHRRLASGDEDLVSVIKYQSGKDLLDPSCKQRFVEYKKGVATPMISADLNWSKIFVSYCIAKRELPRFRHECASEDPFT